MRLQLPSGQEVRIGIKYEDITLEFPDMPERSGTYRNVEIRISNLKNGAEIGTGSASCSPRDRYCRVTGRKIALKRLLTNNHAAWSFTKADRKALFHKICGSLVPKDQRDK